MSPREAHWRANCFRARKVIPMHFGTFPALTGRPEQLGELVTDLETEVWGTGARGNRGVVGGRQGEAYLAPTRLRCRGRACPAPRRSRLRSHELGDVVDDFGGHVAGLSGTQPRCSCLSLPLKRWFSA